MQSVQLSHCTNKFTNQTQQMLGTLLCRLLSNYDHFYWPSNFAALPLKLRLYFFIATQIVHCPAHLNGIGWATQAIWGAIKKYSSLKYSLIPPISQGISDTCSTNCALIVMQFSHCSLQVHKTTCKGGVHWGRGCVFVYNMCHERETLHHFHWWLSIALRNSAQWSADLLIYRKLSW